MKSIVICCFVTFVAICGCKKEGGFTTVDGETAPVTSELKIKIGVNGGVYANNKLLTPEEFLQELQRVKQANGGIAYTLENPNSDSTAAQDAILRVMQQSEVPLKYQRQ